MPQLRDARAAARKPLKPQPARLTPSAAYFSFGTSRTGLCRVTDLTGEYDSQPFKSIAPGSSSTGTLACAVFAIAARPVSVDLRITKPHTQDCLCYKNSMSRKYFRRLIHRRYFM